MSVETADPNLELLQRHIPKYELNFGYNTVLASHAFARQNLSDTSQVEDQFHIDAEIEKLRAEIGLNECSRNDQETLKRLTPEETDLFVKFIELSDIPESIFEMNGVENTQSLITKFRGADLEDPTSSEQFVNFLQWHSHMLVEKQDIFKNERLPKYIRRFEQRLQTAVQMGNESPLALDRFEDYKNRKRKLHIHMDDGIMGYARNSIGLAGHKRDGNPYIVLSVYSDEANEEHTFTHELFHTLEAINNDGQESTDTIERANKGLMRIFGDGIGGIGINEAVTEHRADSLIHGHADTIDPMSRERKHSSQTYFAARLLLHTLSNEGVKNIDIRMFMAASVSDDPKDKKALIESINEAWPNMNIVQQINDLEPEDGQANWRALADFEKDLRAPARLKKRVMHKIGRILLTKAKNRQ